MSWPAEPMYGGAKFAGICALCSSRFAKGAPIYYDRTAPKSKQAACASCVEDSRSGLPDADECPELYTAGPWVQPYR
jgi:hypothetical protein